MHTEQQVVVRGTECKSYVEPLPTNFGSITSALTFRTASGVISTGTSYNQRIGRVVTLNRFTLTGILQGGQSNTAVDDNHNVVRLILATYRVGSVPSLSLNDIMDPRVQDGLIRVYFDRTLTLRSPARDSTGYMPASQPVIFSVKLGKQLLYKGDGANAENTEYLTLIALSDSGVAPSPGFISGYWNLRFTDS